MGSNPADRRARISIVGLLILAAGLGAGATELELAAAGPPPEALSTGVGSALVAAGTRVGASGTTLTFWLRREPPLREGASSRFGVAFPELLEGALVGAVELAEAWRDYRGQTIRPGVYTLRYALRPDDGYHMGVSEHRDFLLLVPATEDPDPAVLDSYQDLVARSRKAASHPAVLALAPVAAADAPAATENDLGQPVLALPCGSLTLGLVVAGTGEI